MTRLTFVGSLQWGKITDGGGVQVKNQHLLRYIQKHTNSCSFFDTYGVNPIFALLVSIWYLIITPKDTPIIFSIAYRGVKTIGFIYSILPIKRRIIYWVAGGGLGDYVRLSSKRARSVLRSFENIVVQGDFIKQTLHQFDIDNVIVIPNFKPIVYQPEEKKSLSNVTKFVYLSRIRKDKGVDEIINAVKELNDNNVTVDFYGKLQDNYTEEFFKKLRPYNIKYCGFIDMNKIDGFRKLSQYDAMLFPTYHDGEGFPGVILDSFIAGVPAIVSNFHANPEIVTHMENGIIVQPKDVKGLASAMAFMRDNTDVRCNMRKNAIKSAKKYEIEFVLEKAFKRLSITL
jgi:glycosyltransferase involved in cell wall biosynthesis